VVGFTEGGGGNNNNGFLYQHGQYRTITFPGAMLTSASGINDSHVISGYYIASNGFFGFVLNSGVFTSLSVPGSVSTIATGINALGEVVGGYTDDLGICHGFVSSPVAGLDFLLGGR
jgi:uncharacterized membrane protein